MAELIFRGLRASYRTWGSGADVALLHAGGSSGAQWTAIAETLNAAYRLIAPDLLGMPAPSLPLARGGNAGWRSTREVGKATSFRGGSTDFRRVKMRTNANARCAEAGL